MSEYDIEIEWIQAWFDGTWQWKVFKDDDLLKIGNSMWRWSGMWSAKRFARRDSKGKIPQPDDDSRKIKYIVWDR